MAMCCDRSVETPFCPMCGKRPFEGPRGEIIDHFRKKCLTAKRELRTSEEGDRANAKYVASRRKMVDNLERWLAYMELHD